MRFARLGGISFVLVAGWLFIAWQNHFHFTPPLVFACLGFFAVVMTTYNLWRTGAAAVAENDEDDGEASWGRPTGARGELDREKRTLLKAIKEAEFDHAMGKLSKYDADEMIAMYRGRAIEVIKEIEQLDLGAAGTVRERILREVKARTVLDRGPKPDEAKAHEHAFDPRAQAVEEPKAEVAVAVEVEAKVEDKVEGKVEDKVEDKVEGRVEDKVEDLKEASS
jgi:hypothetical protein